MSIRQDSIRACLSGDTGDTVVSDGGTGGRTGGSTGSGSQGASCDVQFMSSGGSRKFLVRLPDGDRTSLIVLTAPSEESLQEFLSGFARGGSYLSEYPSHDAAANAAYGLCPSARP